MSRKTQSRGPPASAENSQGLLIKESLLRTAFPKQRTLRAAPIPKMFEDRLPIKKKDFRKAPIMDTPIIPPKYSPIFSGDTIADLTPELGKGLFKVYLLRSGSQTYYLIIEPQMQDESGNTVNASPLAFPVPEEEAYDWIKKNVAPSTYLYLYGTLRGCEKEIPPLRLNRDIIGSASDYEKVRLFAFTIIPRLKWHFAPFNFLHSLFCRWHAQRFSSRECMDWCQFTSQLLKLVDTNYQVGEIGWAHIEYDTPIEPAITMSEPESLIDEFQLVEWKNMRYGSLSVLATEYDPQISNSWFTYLTDVCLRCGITRFCKCNIPIVKGQPIFRDMEEQK